MSRKNLALSRRKFVLTASATAMSSILLKGCMGNPPEDQPAVSGSPTVAAGSGVKAGEEPEVKTAKLGYLPIVESAPLIIASAKGFFAKYGMTDVKVEKQANWGAARDNVKIGSGGGGIDGGQWQMPMPYLITEGIITDGAKIPMYILCQLNTQGNGIAIANKHKGKNVGLKADPKYFADLKASGNRFKAAYTFPKANQDFWIRYWLAGNGIDPDSEVDLLTVPASQTVADMKRGAMDAFSTGDPWPYRIVADDIGFISALTSELWQAHPEEYFAVRQDWADKHPKATKALLKAIMEAQQWCDDFKNRKEMTAILAQREYFGVPEKVLEEPLMGKYNLGERTIDDPQQSVLYWKDKRGSVSYPYQSHDLWFLTESHRWNFLDKGQYESAKALISKVNREDLWKQCAQEIGVPASDIPSDKSRGIEEFFDGVKFDPANPEAYLSSLKIKRV
ncbi:CmpA/NrtA family ABC transporter substrate-binding protein [Alkalinema sp. FACHB-956]|uniref:CmpA/NrtA family ABC transporter substrate-binding protein n=1 Tax=Alkalinema sp. FACHB-956 TaxID=2692768 RepID=UPI001682D37D|nr:CmpA/NrtA family ABC transporter substrate-binding protein [Alkalinema sp. FACHB-956]MBD2326016.1 ABC transporter substrate-binding protein [Alkalinema sp. FACHB-956]